MPLPSPNVGENRLEFIARCIVDDNIVSDFDTIDQRYAVCSSLYSETTESKAIKQAKDDWQMGFEAKLKQSESKVIRETYKYYQREYEKGIAIFIQQQGLQYNNTIGLFTQNELNAIYEMIYIKIGNDFSKWYVRNAEKLKKFDANAYESIWEKNFAFIGSQVAGQRVTGVQGTARKTLISVTQRLMTDKDFMVAGEVVQARILKKEFKKYSTYQAKRLVRTESTFAANYSSMVAAKDVFAGKDLMKEWIAAMDERTRPAHAEANMGKPIPANDKFIVGGEMLLIPGDPAGSAGNVINCRCSAPYFPKPEAEVIGNQITQILGGIAIGEITDLIVGKE